MRDTPESFTGDGREFVYFAESGQQRKAHITIRNYGVWTKYTDGAQPTKMDNAHRTQVSTGGSKTISQTRQLAPTVPLGPPPGPFTGFGRFSARLGRQREYTTTMLDQLLSVGETRMLNHSHPHIDDVYVDVRITDAEEPRLAEKGFLGTP
ncbi:hypothetical protein NKH18_45295 [Streptomyces sp. M10(2022)]